MVNRANSLDGRVVMVTGAAQGIGRGIALRLAAEGARVAVCDLKDPAAKETAEQIVQSGGHARAFHIDVTRPDEVEAGVAAIEQELGPIDALVNNAGWDIVAPFLETLPDHWEKLVAINFFGVLNCCKSVGSRMQQRGQGKIVSLSSDAARVGSSGEAVYAGCKAAIIGFSKTLARELARQRITVNVVCPGPTDTALFREATEGQQGIREGLIRAIPFKRLGEPEDVAGAVRFFVSPDSDFVTGQVLSVSGGLTMAG